MQSDGGLTMMDKFVGSRAVLSGPAGGVVSDFNYTRQGGANVLPWQLFTFVVMQLILLSVHMY